MFDARSWTVWLLAMAVMTMLTRNPVYTLLLLLVARVVGSVCAQPTAVGLKLPLFRIGVHCAPALHALQHLSVHIGETVLARLPAAWPYIGGPLTLEGAVYGAMNGLILLTLLVIFSSFNQIVPTGDLIRLAPPALRDLSVVILIAITYLPETSRQLQRIREAQAVRGHQLRGVRDWPPLVLPLLISGLERAMGVAEAMVARGYGATS
jgi:energy-coupling factor transport system permease protein